MSPLSDANRWNARYLEEPRRSFEKPRAFLVENSRHLPANGLALDAAMGLGANAGFLLERGLRVVGVDVSEVGVGIAKQRMPALMGVVADLERFYLPTAAFDVILTFYYLQRSLWPEYTRALKPGGVLFFETLTVEMLEIQPDIERSYLLEPGELQEAFPELETLVYREGWSEGENGGHRRPTAGLIARRR